MLFPGATIKMYCPALIYKRYNINSQYRTTTFFRLMGLLTYVVFDLKFQLNFYFKSSFLQISAAVMEDSNLQLD